MHTAQGGAAVETQLCRCGDSRMSIGEGPGQARGAEALLSARGAPRPTLRGVVSPSELHVPQGGVELLLTPVLLLP